MALGAFSCLHFNNRFFETFFHLYTLFFEVKSNIKYHGNKTNVLAEILLSQYGNFHQLAYPHPHDNQTFCR